jgi:AraC-like DNA-binding protein
VLEDFVRGRAGEPEPGSTTELAALVASDPAYGVEHLAVETGVSSRQLRRRFDRGVGYGPAFFARIARLQRFARAAARSPGRGIAELAASAGYVDQAHLAKDCRALAGMTPRELLDVLPRTSVAVTVVDHDVRRVRSVQDAGPRDGRRSAA